MRRKPIPSPIETARERGLSRPLSPASRSSRLPTAAALAVALSAFGCSMPIEDGVRPDPVMKKVAPVSAPTAAPSPSPAVKAIDPDPHELDGDVAVVKPAPVSSAPKPFVAGPRPKGTKTAGKPAIVHPTTF